MNLAIDTFPPERFGLITGSRCSPLVPKKSAEVGQRTLAKTLANEIYFRYYDEFGNKNTEHGTMAEFFAMEHYKQHIDERVEKGRFLFQDDCGGSTDAELPEKGIDWKSPTSLGKWISYLHDPLDDEQVNQCQMYMWLTKKEQWDIAAYLTETEFMNDNGLRYPVPEEKRMIIVPVKKDPFWSEKLLSNKPKVIEMRNEFVEKLKSHFA